MMDKIFHSTFDFFSHALPGFCMVFSLFILDANSSTPQDFLDLIGTMGFEKIVLMLALGYILGFAFFPFGRYLYKTLGLRIWKKQLGKNIELDVPEKYTLIRELSPINFKYIEVWNMYCAMSHNLAFSCVLVFFFSLAKIFFLSPSNPLFWVGICFVTVLLFFLFLHRAVVFSNWAAVDLNATIDQLQLQKQAKEIIEIRKG